MHSESPSAARPVIEVLLVSTSYPSSPTDWAGRFIERLAAALATQGGIRLHLWAPPGPRPPGIVDACGPDDARWLARLAAAGGIAQQLRRGLRGMPFVLGLLLRLSRLYRQYRTADVVHVAWLQNALPLWGGQQPAVISVLGTDYALMRYRILNVILRAVLRQRRSIVAPNAPWMVPQLSRELASAGATVRCVAFGVDQTWFALTRQPLPAHRRKWLVVLRVTKAKIGPLFEWARVIQDAGDEVHLFGPRQEALTIPDWITYHGPTHPHALQTQWFPQAAGLITLSQHDEGRPQVVLEAMAAALPVIASKLPAHTELISDGATGFLVGSQHEFQQAFARLSDVGENDRIGSRARTWIRQEIGSWDDCAERYVQLYRMIANSS